MTLELWLAFVAASSLLLVIPGPTVLLVVSYALGQGWRTALPMAVGVALGDFTAMTLSMLGLGALLAASATLFTVLKWIGAAYLIWLGVKLWRAGGTLEATPRTDAVSAARMLGHAWLVTALNPKSITFFVAFLPAAVVGLLFSKHIKAVLFHAVPVALAFIVGGIVILVIEKYAQRPRIKTIDDVDWKTALFIGFCQCLAMIPGVSRSGATIMGARVFRVERATAAEFSFFLAIPTMVGAFAYDLLKNYKLLNANNTLLVATGFAVSFIAGWIVVKSLLEYVSRHGFALFAWWRVLVGSIGLIALALGR